MHLPILISMVDDLIPLSYLSQYYYCKRRAALLLLDQVWEDNPYTAEGSLEHERVHTKRIERRGSVWKIYEMPIYSQEFGLAGKCDCIEATVSEDGAYIPWLSERLSLFPVEYKHGRLRDEEEYNIQLCGQAMCMEEMFDTKIEKGAIFYIDSHRRTEIELGDSLRDAVKEGAASLKLMIQSEKLPAAGYSSKCKKCSLNEICMPKLSKDTDKYIQNLYKEARGGKM